jgi:UDP-glucose 4-epimerase
VWDLAEAHVAALRRFDEVLAGRAYEVVNLGTGKGTTVREFVSAFRTVVGRPLRVRETGPRPGDNAGSFARAQRAADLLGWVPRFSIEDGIRDSMQWSAIRPQRLALGRC